MNIKSSEVTVLTIVVIALIIGIYYYPQMPEQVATHWNIKGEVDGYQTTFWGVFLMPIFLAGLAIVLMLIPRIDPLRENILSFRQYYNRFMILSFMFLFCLYIFIILWNLGTITSSNSILYIATIGSSLLFYYLGVLCENAQRNWFIGIRTPWTLSSDLVWRKTNQIGGILLKVAAVITVLGIIYPSYAVLLILFPISLVAAYTIIYSYFEYQKEVNNSQE